MNRESEPTNRYHFEVFRYNAADDQPPRFAEYELSARDDVSVLESLLMIRDTQDPTLAFRYSCRGAVCGSCAMSISGKLQLACRILLGDLASKHVVIEPLPGFHVIRDLVVDMNPFWEKYESVEPWLHADITGDGESRQGDRDRQRIDQYVNCILCGLCYAACPVKKLNPDFKGPAALAKLERFLADSREDRDSATLAAEDTQAGLWGCHTITRCIDACPKNVRPTDAIESLRRRLTIQKLKSLFRRAE